MFRKRFGLISNRFYIKYNYNMTNFMPSRVGGGINPDRQENLNFF